MLPAFPLNKYLPLSERLDGNCELAVPLVSFNLKGAVIVGASYQNE